MRCIYLSGKTCYAIPVKPLYLIFTRKYQPTEEDKKAYCEGSNFLKCPRAIATIEHLKAIKG
jgi:hypothetical protein